jgi:2-keto-3-deoxy-L-rhamnonate aldolase RhmA
MSGHIYPLMRNRLAETLASGGLGVALIVQKMQSVDIALAAHACGCDAISIDLEHSVIPESAAAQICVTALYAGVTPLVRVPSLDGHYANRLLDAGALGVIAPHVSSAEEARAVVRACKFAPEGDRSSAGNWPHVGYRPREPHALRQAFNAATTVIVMLESPEAVARADEIAAVPGVDIVHVGTVDLCDALGRPADYGHPEVMACHERVIRACQRHGKTAGAGGLAHTPALVRQVVEMGARFVTAGVDWDLMMAGVRQRVAGLRELTVQP